MEELSLQLGVIDEEDINEFTPLKKRLEKGGDATKRRREDKVKYRKDKRKIAITRKKRKKKEDSTGITKKRERMDLQGKTVKGERKTVRVK